MFCCKNHAILWSEQKGRHSKIYNKMMNEACALATKRMIAEAEQLGDDAVVNIRYASLAIMQGMAEVIAYGIAVKFVP